MSRNIRSIIMLCLAILLTGYLIGYVVDHTTMQTYWILGRAINALWLASLVLFICGVIYRVIFNKLSTLNGVLLLIVISSALLLHGFYLAIGNFRW